MLGIIAIYELSGWYLHMINGIPYCHVMFIMKYNQCITYNLPILFNSPSINKLSSESNYRGNDICINIQYCQNHFIVLSIFTVTQQSFEHWVNHWFTNFVLFKMVSQLTWRVSNSAYRLHIIVELPVSKQLFKGIHLICQNVQRSIINIKYILLSK